MKKVYLIHTTKTIVNYFDGLYNNKADVVHIVREDLLDAINQNDNEFIDETISDIFDKIKLTLRDGDVVMVTCTALGEYLSNRNKEKNDLSYSRIEDAAIRKLVATDDVVGVVYTNSPVYAQIRKHLISSGVKNDRIKACFVPKAFDEIKAGNFDQHDELIVGALENNKENVSMYFLAQVSICSANSRKYTFEDVHISIISVAEEAVKEIFE